MDFQIIDLEKMNTIGPSNGTTIVPFISLGESDNFIVIENISMFSGKFVLRDAPTQTQEHIDGLVRPEVSVILERSLKEHAATWEELAKH